MTTIADARRGSEYAGLSRAVRAANLLDRRRWNYAARMTITGVALAGCWFVFVVVGNSWYQALVAAALGIVFTQIGFLGHDGGHQQIARKRFGNDLIGLIAGNLLTGLSIGWWVDKHNRHHAQPEQGGPRPRHRRRACSLHRRARGQAHRTVRPLDPALPGVAVLPAAHARGPQPARGERPGSSGDPRRAGSARPSCALLAVHAVGYLDAVCSSCSRRGKALAFLAMHQGVFGLYMGCSFAPNHKGMPIVDRTRTSTTCGARCSPRATCAAAGSSTSCWAG